MSAKFSIIVVLCGLLFACTSGTSAPQKAQNQPMNVTYQPPNGIHMMSTTSVNLTVWYNLTVPSINATDQFVLLLTIKNSLVSEFSNTTSDFPSNFSIVVQPNSRNITEGSVTLQLNGLRVGITSMNASLLQDSTGASIWKATPDYAIRVTKIPSTLNTGLRLGAMGAMSLNFLTFGCKLRYGSIKRYIKSPSGIIIGFLCQYGLMPTVSTAYRPVSL